MSWTVRLRHWCNFDKSLALCWLRLALRRLKKNSDFPFSRHRIALQQCIRCFLRYHLETHRLGRMNPSHLWLANVLNIYYCPKTGSEHVEGIVWNFWKWKWQKTTICFQHPELACWEPMLYRLVTAYYFNWLLVLTLAGVDIGEGAL